MPDKTRLPNSTIEVGRRLRKSAHLWKRLDRWAFNVVKKGLSWRWLKIPPKSVSCPPQKSNSLIRQYIQEMLDKGVIQKTKRFIFRGRLFSVPKKDTLKRRMILDVSKINKFIVCPKFKMISIQQVRQVVQKGNFVTSIDLKDAYWHIPIMKSFQKFLAFEVDGSKFVFQNLPPECLQN